MPSHLLHNRDFVIALVSRAGSLFGDEVALVALTLRLQGAGGHPWQVAVLLGAGTVPLILLSSIVGRIVDSADSKRILLVATVAETAACAPLIFTHNFAVMVGLVAAIAAASSVSSTTWQALTPTMVGESQIGRATSASQTAFALGAVGAPAVAGLLSGLFGTGVPLALDTASFTLMTVAALTIRSRRHVSQTQGEGSARSGWVVLRHDHLLGTLVAGLSVFVFFGMMVNVVGVFLVRVTLHASTAWYGGTEAIWTVGIIVGSVLAGKFGGDLVRARAAVAGAVVIALSLIAYAVVPSVVWLLPIGLLGGAGNGLVNVCVSTLITTRTADHLRGRVFATLGASVATASIFSLAIGGIVGGVISPRHVYLAAGACSLAAAALMGIRMARSWHAAPSTGEPTTTDAGVLVPAE
ncbi:MAG: MFS transporter [Candidatus Dormibacteria bacterium]